MKIDPRTCMVLALFGVVMIIATPSLPALAALFIPLVALIRCRESFRRFRRWLRWVLPMVFFFGLVTGWSLSPAYGLLAAVRLLGLTLVGHLFFIATPPEDVANALVKSGLPYRIAFVVHAGLQFVPVLARKARGVLDAQQTRGIPIGMGRQAWRHYPAFLVPLLVQSFQLAEELAEAMETRGFGRPGRTFFHDYTLRRRDWAIMGAGLAAAAAWLWGVYTWL